LDFFTENEKLGLLTVANTCFPHSLLLPCTEQKELEGNEEEDNQDWALSVTVEEKDRIASC